MLKARSSFLVETFCHSGLKRDFFSTELWSATCALARSRSAFWHSHSFIPGEEGGGGVQAWRSLLLGFQRAPSLSQSANVPQELSLLALRMRTAQGHHSSSRKRCNSKAAWLRRLCDLPSSRLLAEGKPNFTSTEQVRKLRHKQEGKCA